MQLTTIQSKIFEIRDQKVMLDIDLAEMYEVPTKALKQAVKRNIDRFPADFMFELNADEFSSLRSQTVTSKRGGTRYMPYAFTEQGVAMLSTILTSRKAICVNIATIRTFVLLRQHAYNYKELARKIEEVEMRYGKQFEDICEALNLLLEEHKIQEKHKERERIGFKKN